MKKWKFFFLIPFLVGCGLKEYKGGHLIAPKESAMVGSLRTKSDILKTLGTPGGTNLFGEEEVWMYLSYEKEQTAFFKPVDKSFDLIIFHFQKGQEKVREINRYDLTQKMDLTPNSETTPIPGEIKLSPFQELFNNIGRFAPSTAGQ